MGGNKVATGKENNRKGEIHFRNVSQEKSIRNSYLQVEVLRGCEGDSYALISRQTEQQTERS